MRMEKGVVADHITAASLLTAINSVEGVLNRFLEEGDIYFTKFSKPVKMRSCTLCLILLLCGTTLLVENATCDDTAMCCMKGLKQLRDVVLCPMPCCRGYIEHRGQSAALKSFTWCAVDKAYVKGGRNNSFLFLQ
ncbi:uncharacterized protein LOC106174919 isoform X2 [Lingula anatina]|nr:uncharacterized protein LOC106174919 isoform X2 [Lingula anatina]|eukprot:XP_013412147.1 uncharacterized protein LOC106174919 isoform X2 [Lingula anatina]